MADLKKDQDAEIADTGREGDSAGKDQENEGQSGSGVAQEKNDTADAGSTDKAGEAGGDHAADASEQRGSDTDSQEEPVRGRFQKRIDILTRQKHEAERQREEAVKYAKSVLEDNRRLREQGFGVAERAVDTAEARYIAEYEVAKRDLREAFEAGDADKVADAQARLATIAVERREVKNYAGKIKEQRVAQEKAPAPETRVGFQEDGPLYNQPDPRAVEWSERNPWFGKDEIATQVAWALHGRLVREGVDPRSDEYWSSLDKALKTELPHKFAAQQQANGQAAQRTAVAPATRRAAPSAKPVQLTPSQEHIIRRLGISRDAYLAQLKATES